MNASLEPNEYDGERRACREIVGDNLAKLCDRLGELLAIAHESGGKLARQDDDGFFFERLLDANLECWAARWEIGETAAQVAHEEPANDG